MPREPHPITYFVPGEAIITFEHHVSPDNRDELVQLLRAHPILQGEYGYRTLLQDLPGISEHIEPDRVDKLRESGGLQPALDRLKPETIQTFAAGKERYLSFAYLRSAENELLNDDLTLAYLTAELTYQSQRDLSDDRNRPLQLQAVTPNWFFSGTPASLTDGGPGARPVPPLAVQLGQPITQADYGYSPRELPAAPRKLAPAKVTLDQAFGSEGSNNATVFILDAVPPVTQLEEAYNAWGKTDINPLLKRLLAPQAHTSAPRYYETARLKLHYYPVGKDRQFHTRRTKDHNYRMADHGLFIAGIIDSLAPEADIRMIEVLNRHGVGTFQSLIWGLKRVLAAVNKQGINRFLVNCSLMMALPHDPSLPMAPNNRVISFYRLAIPLVNLSETIRHLFDDIIIQSGGAIVVAAAGNDSELPTLQVAARFPAAFGSVIGVGALTKSGEIARYSNYADDPPVAGFLAFGGDTNFNEASSTDGIMSIFTAETYPEGEVNTSGWACWAGTSFACAVVCGTLAQLYNQGMSAASAEQLLKDVSLEDQATSAHYIPIVQGRP